MHPMKNLLKSNRTEENKLVAKEKTMKFIGLPTTSGYTLIPRAAMTTHIRVCAIHTDMWMDNSRRQQTSFYPGISTSDHYPIDVINDTLHVAASQGNIVGVREWVSKNKELVWLSDSQGNLPLHLAVERGHKEVALYLIREYAQGSYALNKLNKSPLYLAVVHGHIDLVENMLQNLAGDIKAIHSLRKGSSIVCEAVYAQNQEMVQLILKYQRKLHDCTNDDGWTSLSCAAYNGHLGIVCFLLNKFPTLAKTPNKDLSYPIHKACLGGQVSVLKIFHAHYPASLTMRDQDGLTILHLAAKLRGNKLKDVVAYLLSLRESGELVKMTDENDRTPFDLAGRSKNYEVVELFLQSMRP